MNDLQNPLTMSEEKSIQVHPSAVVDPRAEIHEGVIIGPGAFVGPDVKIGAQTKIGPNVVIDGRVTLGEQNKVFPGACLGLEPQDLKYRGAYTEVFIGNRNTIRECVTVNRATNEGESTLIGDDNLLMAYSHLGHNSVLGNGIVMSNAVQVAGHVVIEDRAVIGGCLGIHQFVHIGSLAMVGGMTKVERDVPPYCLVEGRPGRIRGLNKVGLKRSGMNNNDRAEEFKQLKEIWTLLFRSNHVLNESLDIARQKKLLPLADHLCSFMHGSIGKGRRGPMPALQGVNY